MNPALQLAEALARLNKAHHELEEAKSRVPLYTGDAYPEDYYLDESREHRAAAIEFYDLIKP